MVCKQHFEEGDRAGTGDILFTQGMAPHRQQNLAVMETGTMAPLQKQTNKKKISFNKWTPEQDLVAFTNWSLAEVPVISSRCCCH